MDRQPNFLLPQLDSIGRYRWRGFGNDLSWIRWHGCRAVRQRVCNLFHGDFQEWQFGMEFNVPIGYRRGAAAVRNAELQLARSRALLA